MKEARGIVVSAHMKRAVVVRIERLVQHPVYSKVMVQRTKVRARDEIGCKEGDVVDVTSCRPLSRTIRWRVVKVVGQRAIPDAPDDVLPPAAKQGAVAP